MKLTLIAILAAAALVGCAGAPLTAADHAAYRAEQADPCRARSAIVAIGTDVYCPRRDGGGAAAILLRLE